MGSSPTFTFSYQYFVQHLLVYVVQLRKMMAWKRIIVLLVVLAVTATILARLRMYYVKSGAIANLLWNSNEAYVFINDFRSGYSFSYLGYLSEVVREVFPFGASPPERQHFCMIVLHITPETTERHVVDNFHAGSPPFVVGQNIYAGNLSAETGPTKWSGTYFEPMTSEEYKAVQDAQHGGGIPISPSYDNFGGWSRRMVDVVSPESDAKITMEIAGKQLSLLAHSGAKDHEAYIDVTRPGQPPDRMWHLNERSQRVSKATYNQIFGNN